MKAEVVEIMLVVVEGELFIVPRVPIPVLVDKHHGGDSDSCGCSGGSMQQYYMSCKKKNNVQ